MGISAQVHSLQLPPNLAPVSRRTPECVRHCSVFIAAVQGYRVERSCPQRIGCNAERTSPVARGDHGVDAWADGEMGRGGEGNRGWKTSAAFISGKLIPAFVHLAPSDRTGRLWLTSTLLHPSIVMGLSRAVRREAGY